MIFVSPAGQQPRKDCERRPQGTEEGEPSRLLTAAVRASAHDGTRCGGTSKALTVVCSGNSEIRPFTHTTDGRYCCCGCCCYCCAGAAASVAAAAAVRSGCGGGGPPPQRRAASAASAEATAAPECSQKVREPRIDEGAQGAVASASASVAARRARTIGAHGEDGSEEAEAQEC